MIKPPFPTPWSSNREGAVTDAEGRVFGYIRFELMGDLPARIAAARYWAASPDLTEALVRMISASDELVRAMRARSGVRDAAAGLQLERAHAVAQLRRLLDPALRTDAEWNQPVAAMLEALDLGQTKQGDAA